MKSTTLVFICEHIESESHLLIHALNANKWKILLGNPIPGSVRRLPKGRRHSILQNGIHIQNKGNQSGTNCGSEIEQVRLTFAKVDHGQGG